MRIQEKLTIANLGDVVDDVVEITTMSMEIDGIARCELRDRRSAHAAQTKIARHFDLA